MDSRLALAAAVCYVLSLPMSAALILAWAFERASLEFVAWFVTAGSVFAAFLWSLWGAGYRPWLFFFGYFITGCYGRGVFRRGC